jgi:hypothetical protein
VKIVKPIGYFEDHRQKKLFLLDKATLTLTQVQETMFKKWKAIIEQRMER